MANILTSAGCLERRCISRMFYPPTPLQDHTCSVPKSTMMPWVTGTDDIICMTGQLFDKIRGLELHSLPASSSCSAPSLQCTIAASCLWQLLNHYQEVPKTLPSLVLHKIHSFFLRAMAGALYIIKALECTSTLLTPRGQSCYQS